MNRSFRRARLWVCLAGGCLLQGCFASAGQVIVDPDLIIRARLSVLSDFMIFLLENLVAPS